MSSDRILERGATGQRCTEIPTCLHACMIDDTFHVMTMRREHSVTIHDPVLSRGFPGNDIPLSVAI